MKRLETERMRATKAKAGLLLFALALSFSTFGVPAPAHAQGIATVEGAGPLLTAAVGDTVDRKVTDVLVQSATLAVVNATNYFASQIAYSAAVALTSDCPGQGPCWNSKAFSQGFREAWQGAVGEAIGTLSQGLLGNNFLCSPNPLFTLTLQLGLIDELKPPKPKCDFNAIVSGWDTLISSVETGALLKQMIPTFQPGANPIGVSLNVMDGVVKARADAERAETMKYLMDASAGGGFSAVRDPVSGRVKSPQAVVENEFRTMEDARNKDPQSQAAQYNAGSIAGRAATAVVLNATQTFVQTLVARLWNKLVNGLLSTEDLLSKQPDLIFDPEGALVPGKSGVQAALQTRAVTATARDAGTIDPLLDFISCPGSDPGPNNCVMDAQFANAVRLGDVTPLTVKEAMDKGMLHKEWPLIPSSVTEKDRDAFCYTYGYCESNLKKLRATRILPIGWEIAAHNSAPNSFASLGEVVSRFNDCNDKGESDSQHPWCHLINPDWVLKVPPTQCRAMVSGPSLQSSAASGRADVCADAPSCLRQDDSGACVGGWGYCLQERNAWRFQGDACPAQFNSCRTLSTRTGDPVSFLMNTVSPGVCNADNVGCTAYSLNRNLTQDDADQSDDWLTSPVRYLNKDAKTCNASDNGCSALVQLAPDQSLNLVRNGSFEILADGDGNGSPEHPDFWSPYGSIASGPGSFRNDGSKSASGSNAMLVRAQSGSSTSRTDDNLSTNDGNSTLNAGTCTLDDACDEADGCTCTQNYFSRVATCRVVQGATTCGITDRVAQDGITVHRGSTYTVSATFIPTNSVTAVGGKIAVRLFNSTRGKVSASGSLASSMAFSGGSVALSDRSCEATSDGLLFAFDGTRDSDSNGIRASCTFTIDASVATATIDLFGSDSHDMYVDDVQMEEGTLTPFHEGYGNAATVANLKLPPAYLGCTGEATDDPSCASFTRYCRANESGCTKYQPANGDPSVPAIVGPQDFCPAECSGYDIFKQEATDFDQEKFPVDFIPSTATQCTEAESGCSQFTDVETEQVDYYSKLRLCEKPSTDPETVFYSWEGSDTSGFQLKVWNLKKTAAHVSASSNDVKPTAVGTDAGVAPCTKLKSDATTCDSRDNGSGTKTDGICTRADIDAGDFDCREFYDANGNRHYRQLSKTILLTADCREYRITTSTQTDCENSNGKWLTDRQQCIYNAHSLESSACSATANGCHPYKGNAAGNVRTVLTEGFEGGQNGWSDGSISEDSIVAGGHSLKLSGSDKPEKSVTGTVATGRSYTVSFWAHGSGTITTSFDAATDVNFGSTAVTSNWRQYVVGPVNSASPSFGTGSTALRFAKSGGVDVFIDNIQLQEVRDNIYVVRDSWRTPVSCDSTVQGLPSPQEMLGCKEYTDAKGAKTYLRSFAGLCREQAVGCSAYSYTQNSVDNPYAESFNAVCELSSSCTAAKAVAGTCSCDYKPLQPAMGDSSKPRQILSDVCRVTLGDSSCRFHLDRADDGSASSAYPDRVNIASDARVYIVPNDTMRCTAAAVGCKQVGVQQLKHEVECVRSNKNGGSCTVNGATCTVPVGSTTCTAIFDDPQISGWATPAILDNPATYGSSLCLANAVSCEEFRGNDGTFYFKHPQSSTCVFKEGVTVNGASVSGWFRKSESGVDEPCNPELLKNGDFYDLAKNADGGCDLGSVCTSANGCSCSDDNGSCRVAKGHQKCGYQGWVGECSPEFDRCEEFLDPAATTPTQPKGTPYYYLLNSKIDLKSCAGGASLEEGCVLFNRTGNPALTSNAKTTYANSESSANGGPVSPVNCNSNPKAAGCGSRVNDANIVIKVRRDRECAQWLACSATDAVWDQSKGQWKNVCTSLDACEQQRNVGDSQECSKWADVPVEKLTQDAYVARDVTYQGKEYSGYSLPEKYPVQYVSLAQAGDEVGEKRYGVVIDQSKSCDTSAECPNGGTCSGNKCYYDLSGGALQGTSAGSCRGYPEADAPFDRSVLDSSSGATESRKSSFRGANVCADGNSVCDCSYIRMGYGGGGAFTRFLSLSSPQNDFGSVCSGGPNEGANCTAQTKTNDICDQEKGGSCVVRSRITKVVGWEGYCVDPDFSYNVDGDQTRYACNLWLPVDRLPGAPDLNNQEQAAGFLPDQDYSYCSDAPGNKTPVPSALDVVEGIRASENDEGQAGSGYKIPSLPIYGVRSLLSDPSTSSRFCPEDDKPQSMNISAANAISENETSYILVRVGTGTGADTLGSSLFLLYPGNGWSANNDFDDSAHDGKDVNHKGVYACEEDGEDVLCRNRIFAQSKEGVRNNEDGTYLGITAVWNNGKLSSLRVLGNADDTAGDGCDSDDVVYQLYPFAVMRESCTEVKTVSNLTQQYSTSVAWTDRIWKSFQPKSSGYDFAHTSTNYEPPQPGNQQPYGRIAQAGGYVSGGYQYTAASNSTKGDTDWPMQVWTTEGGSVGGMHITCGSGSDAHEDNGCTCKQSDYDGQDVCTISFDSGHTASGIPFACEGDCRYTGSGGVPGLNDGWDDAGSNASSLAADHLGQIFARIYGTYRWTGTVSSDGSKGTYATASSGVGKTDLRSDNASVSTAPQVRSVNTQACSGVEGNCPEGSAGITVNNFMRGNLTGTGGKYRAVLKFYAYADKDHMPIRKRTVDFEGDDTPDDDPSGNASFYQNHRGCVTNNDGTCDGVKTICALSDELAANWGLTPEACKTGYFTVTNTYTCTESAGTLKTNGNITLSTCSPTSGYPCKRSVDIAGQGAVSVCVFKPQVRIVDNWGQCNGTCPGGAGTGSVCINKPDDFDYDKFSGECKGASPNSWTPYEGEIQLAP